MPKKLAVFCDGTWNDLRTSDLTNVARLAKCVAPVDPATDMRQIVYYDEGVGVSSNISKTTDHLVHLAGGAFGRGLDRKIEAAYRFLVLNFEPQDEIFIFGFSRGAYTARSLCGLIRKCGIVRRDCFDRVPEAMALYRDRDLKPKDAEVSSFRENYSNKCSAGAEDTDWVKARLGDKQPEEFKRVEHNGRAWLSQHRPSYAYRIMYLGVWDTVGSLGVPKSIWILQSFNKKYRFHDTELSSLLASVRHAVAIEEDRRVFDVTRMGNIAELNGEWAVANAKREERWDVVRSDAPNYVPYNHRPYQQVWFPGGHGAVGGGNPEPGLYNATLLWIAEGACWAGLAFDQDPRIVLQTAAGRVNPLANWRVDKRGKPQSKRAFDLLALIGGRLKRKGPPTSEEIGVTAKLRWRANEKWRPRTAEALRVVNPPVQPPPSAPPGFPAPPPGCPAVPLSYPQ